MPTVCRHIALYISLGRSEVASNGCWLQWGSGLDLRYRWCFIGLRRSGPQAPRGVISRDLTPSDWLSLSSSSASETADFGLAGLVQACGNKHSGHCACCAPSEVDGIGRGPMAGMLQVLERSHRSVGAPLLRQPPHTCSELFVYKPQP